MHYKNFQNVTVHLVQIMYYSLQTSEHRLRTAPFNTVQYMEYIIGWRGPPAEKWIICRRAYTVNISPFPDAYVASLPFVGTQPA